MAKVKHWPLRPLDLKNAFLYGDLQEEVYMVQPPSHELFGEPPSAY